MMPVYSHSQLSMYEQCPLKYKLCYRDRIKRDVTTIEAFLGNVVHDTLKKCYDMRRATPMSLDALLPCYDDLWQREWNDSIVITRQDTTADDYRAHGHRMLEAYHKRYAPFDSDVTLGTEVRVIFSLDDDNKYRLQGYIDRLSRAADSVYEIHDYKTSAHLPGQEDADRDRQLGLYHIGVCRQWPDFRDIRLVWHYLAFDTELRSSRSNEAISRLTADTTRIIDKIEADEDFPPHESNLCEWCEYPDLCPMRKHLYVVEALPANEYLKEPGVVLVNRYAELKEKASEIDKEIGAVKEALVDYARREQVNVIRGSNRMARVRFDTRLKFPGKNDPQRAELDDIIMQAGKWMEVSQLDTAALARMIDEEAWGRELIEQVLSHGTVEETTAVYLSKLKDEEE